MESTSIRILTSLFFLLVVQCRFSTAQSSTSAPTPAPSSGDGGGSTNIQPGDIGSTASGAAQVGASGSGDGGFYLSTGAIVAIVVVCTIVIVLGAASAVLFYLAKKRQWKIRETIRQSARKFSSAVKSVASPRTPHKMTFSPIDKPTRRGTGGVPTRRDFPQMTENKLQKQQPSRREIDLEKGSHTVTITAGDSDLKKPEGRPSKPTLAIPKSAFDMDSPLSAGTGFWSKVFGRR